MKVIHLKDNSLESDRLAILNQFAEIDTIKIAYGLFNSFTFGSFVVENLNIYLWLPREETDSFMVRSRITKEETSVQFFEILFYTLEHELLHKVLYEVFDCETTTKFDCEMINEAFPINKFKEGF